MGYTSIESSQDSKYGPVKSLNLFVDAKYVLRLKTRISEREDVSDFRYPALLPSDHPVVTRLIHETHVKANHVGVQGLLSLLRERFWIVKGSMRQRYEPCARAIGGIMNIGSSVTRLCPGTSSMNLVLWREVVEWGKWFNCLETPPSSFATPPFHFSTLMSPMIAWGVQPEDPNSLDQLLQFTENGVCRADGDWSMDYWDPYGLDEGLRGCITTGVTTSTPQETSLLIGATHDATDVLRPSPGILPLVPLPSAPLYAVGNASPSVCADLDTLDRLIYKYRLQVATRLTTYYMCSSLSLSQTPLYRNELVPFCQLGDCTNELETGNGTTVLPPPLATSLPHHSAGAPPLSPGDGARAPTVLRETGPMESAMA
uniref:Integrase zinc-binding domain-containing protein n=1 Tax=Timema poppense TaxID=170557 RepID=A0A7R9D4H4_TIMPO|nr:unnamed protein product [Timema poppensis]